MYRWVPAFFAVVFGLSSCAHRPPMLAGPVSAGPCRQAIPDRNVTWIAPADARDLGRLGRWCQTVGPVLVDSPAPAQKGSEEGNEDSAGAAIVDRLAIVTWNVHVGGGDIEDLTKRLRRGDFTDGRPVSNFVLLLQEAHRQSLDVPADVPSDAPVPAAIVEHQPDGIRRDVGVVAQATGLHLFYAPAMRNHRPEAPEDRGGAILSTLPLSDLQVIELPFERQRRVALAATVAGQADSRGPWRLRLASAHVDTSLALTRGGPFAARKRQAEALVEALESPSTPDPTRSGPLPVVVGGDFNTWLGPKEPALEVMRRAFPDTPPQPDAATWRGPLGARAALDYVFARGDFASVTTRRLAERFGSDHYPLLTLVDF